MRILILTQNYHPEPIALPHDLARGMQGRGHTATVVTTFPNYPEGRIYPGYRQKLYQWEYMDGVRVLRLPVYPDHSLSIGRRIASYLSYAITTTLLGPILTDPADLIFVYQLPSIGIPAWWLGFLRRIPVIFNVQDIYPESLAMVGVSPESIGYKLANAYVQRVYESAAAISVISQGFKRNLIERGIPAEKIHVILSWADENIYRPLPADRDLARMWGMDNRFNVVFAGNMGPPQKLEAVIEAATLVADMPAIQFVFIGDGSAKNALVQSAQSKKLSNVRFIPRQPSYQMASFFALADTLLVHLTDDPLFVMTIPCKTQSYLACGKPIIMAAKGDAADLINEARAGLVVRPADPLDLARAVRELYLMPHDKRQKMGEQGRSYFLKNLTISASLDKYEALFQDVISRQQLLRER
jgi:glycosyltransferase involved in cell wall biosynthesis